MDKQKAFIVYATEDYDLTQNFVDQFSIHNFELEILYDKNPYSNTIDDQLIGYAKNCDIAVILASPRLMAPFHYSNQKEIPLLIERRKKGEIMIVGVWLKDTNVTKWNETGDINFFQGRFAEYRFSRQEGPYAAKFNSIFAVYELLDERDRSSYHKNLREWIQSVETKSLTKTNPIEAADTPKPTVSGYSYIGRSKAFNYESLLEFKSQIERRKRISSRDCKWFFGAAGYYISKNEIYQLDDFSSFRVISKILKKFSTTPNILPPELQDSEIRSVITDLYVISGDVLLKIKYRDFSGIMIPYTQLGKGLKQIAKMIS